MLLTRALFSFWPAGGEPAREARLQSVEKVLTKTGRPLCAPSIDGESLRNLTPDTTALSPECVERRHSYLSTDSTHVACTGDQTERRYARASTAVGLGWASPSQASATRRIHSA